MARNNSLSTSLSRKLSKICPEELRHVFFQDRQSMQRGRCHPGFFADLLQSEDLVGGAATRTKPTLAILLFLFHYFSAFPFEAFSFYFQQFVRCLWCPFMDIGIITPVCQSSTQLDTQALTTEFLLRSALSISRV